MKTTNRISDDYIDNEITKSELSYIRTGKIFRERFKELAKTKKDIDIYNSFVSATEKLIDELRFVSEDNFENSLVLLSENKVLEESIEKILLLLVLYKVKNLDFILNFIDVRTLEYVLENNLKSDVLELYKTQLALM